MAGALDIVRISATTPPAAGIRSVPIVTKLVDTSTCIGCKACEVACKEWNEQGQFGPLPDDNARGAEPLGVWFNRVHSYEIERPAKPAMTVHFPRSCLHCETPDCVTVCPTGASYKRAEDGIVLIDADNAALTATQVGSHLGGWFSFQPLYAKITREQPDLFD